MSDKPISDLRRRLIADMTIRTFSDKTQRDYIRQIESFARFLGRSPDTATGDDIRRFQLAQVEQGGLCPPTTPQSNRDSARRTPYVNSPRVPCMGLLLSSSFDGVVRFFLWFDRAAGFLLPRPQILTAVARRSRQGWPPHRSFHIRHPCQAIP